MRRYGAALLMFDRGGFATLRQLLKNLAPQSPNCRACQRYSLLYDTFAQAVNTLIILISFSKLSERNRKLNLCSSSCAEYRSLKPSAYAKTCTGTYMHAYTHAHACLRQASSLRRECRSRCWFVCPAKVFCRDVIYGIASEVDF